MIKCIALIIFLTCSISFIGQEKKIRILKANSLQYDKEIKDAQQLIGNVLFEHDSAYMYCDTALLYVANNSFEAFSNVRIEQGDSIRMTGDSVTYSGEDKIARLKGNIHFTDGKLQLVTDQLDYDLNTKVGYYTNGATITSLENNNVLISKIGSYQSESKTLFFKDSVKLTNPKYVIESDTLTYNTVSEVANFHGATTIISDSNYIYCEHGWYDTKNEKSAFWQNSYLETKEQKLSGDSIFYDRSLGIGEAFGNVLIQDTTNKVDIQGGYAFYNEITDSSLVTDCPLFTQYFEKDTLYLIADTLSIKQDTTLNLNVFRAYHNVLLYKLDLQASCDSLIYSEIDSMMYFMNTPIIWSDENQLTGKRIDISTYGGVIEHMYIDKKATIISEADSTGSNFNQIQGKSIEGFFNKDNKLETVFVRGNGEVIYFMGEDKKPVTDINHTQCAEMKITLKKNEIDKIKFYTKPTASLNAIADVNKEDRKLSNFNWDLSKRPYSLNDLLEK